MVDELDGLMGKLSQEPPDDFLEVVMQRIDDLPLPVRAPRADLQWIALIAAALAGFAQLIAFLFGIWAASAAV